MPMRRVLIVAYYFPPIGGIGSIRQAGFAKHLPQFGWEPTVIAPRSTPHAADPYLDYPQDRVVRSFSIELSRLGRAVPAPRRGHGSENGRQSGRSLHETLRAAAHRFVFYPDGQVGWYPGATLAGLRLLRREPFDLVYSSSNPITAHLIGGTLSARARLPWVAEFRDPYSDRLPSDHPHRARAAAREAAIARRATKVVVPTPGMASYYGERWATEIALIPNGHDVERIPAPQRPERPTLTHVGTCYPGRQSFRALWAAIARLREDPAAEVPRVRFVGDLPSEVRGEVAEAGIADLVDTTGFLPHEQAMQAMVSSSMLIASGFTGSDPVSRGVIPAKLFEYLASGLPILYVGSRVDDAGSLLARQPGCYIVDSTDVSGVQAVIESGMGTGPYERDVEQFSRRSRTRALAEVFDQAATVSPDSGG
jgi:glycosyltransferase involved in cell wall biosynthesis